MNTMNISTQIIEDEMEFWSVPSLSIAVVKNGCTPYYNSFGISDVENGIESKYTTNYIIASCSKAMTSAVIAILVDKGLLDYDVPITNYIESFKLFDQNATTNLTIRDILCHRSGLGGHDTIWPNQKSITDFINGFEYLRPSGIFREKAQYSNIMYSVLGAIVEKVTALPWPEAIKKYLFDPLEMHSTYSAYSNTITDTDIAKPYQIINNRLTELKYWNLDSVSPAASVSTNAIDMSKWLTFLVNHGCTTGDEQLISKETFKQMCSKQIDYDDALGVDINLFPTDGYAMGWQTGWYRNHYLIKHMGKIEGFSAIQIVLPEPKIAIALMMNLHSPSVPIFHTIAYTILDSLLDTKKTDWVKIFRKDTIVTAETYNDCNCDLYANCYPNAHPIVNKIVNPSYLGKYLNNGYGELTIEKKQNKLLMLYNQREYTLNSFLSCPYEIKNFKEDIISYNLPLNFITNTNNEAIAIKARFEPLIDDIIFHKVQ